MANRLSRESVEVIGFTLRPFTGNVLSRESVEVLGIYVTRGNYLSRESVEVIGIVQPAAGPTFKVILV